VHRDHEYHPERADQRRSGGDGPDVPRGGRSGSTSRPRQPADRDVTAALRQQLDLPRGDARERVELRDRSYQLRDSDVRVLATIGAFRVVDASDIQTDRDRWHGELHHLREAGLIEGTRKILDGRPTTVVSLTDEGRRLLEEHQRERDDDPRQQFYAGVAKPRELAHDARLYRAYTDAADRLATTGARVQRVVLDYELKREYQQYLQANNRQHRRASGRPDRSPEEIQAWAAAHDLTIVDGRVQFPDVRIEYERPDAGRGHEDLELATEHYNARQIAAKHAAGFSMHGSGAGRLGGSGGRSGGRPFDPHAAERVLG